MSRRILAAALLVPITALVVACGGSGGGSTPATPAVKTTPSPVRAGNFLVEITNGRSEKIEGGHKIAFDMKFKNVSDKPRSLPDMRGEFFAFTDDFKELVVTKPESSKTKAVAPGETATFTAEGFSATATNGLRVNIRSAPLGASEVFEVRIIVN